MPMKRNARSRTSTSFFNISSARPHTRSVTKKLKLMELSEAVSQKSEPLDGQIAPLTAAHLNALNTSTTSEGVAPFGSRLQRTRSCGSFDSCIFGSTLSSIPDDDENLSQELSCQRPERARPSFFDDTVGVQDFGNASMDVDSISSPSSSTVSSGRNPTSPSRPLVRTTRWVMNHDNALVPAQDDGVPASIATPPSFVGAAFRISPSWSLEAHLAQLEATKRVREAQMADASMEESDLQEDALAIHMGMGRVISIPDVPPPAQNLPQPDRRLRPEATEISYPLEEQRALDAASGKYPTEWVGSGLRWQPTEIISEQ